MTNHQLDNQRDAIEHNLDLGWELLSAQPTHPKVGELAAQVIAAQPERSSASLLLGLHLEASGRLEEAKRVFLQVAGRRDNHFVTAAQCLRHVSFGLRDHAEALRWADVAIKEEPESWGNVMELGSAMAENGDLDHAWQRLDDAVAMCARTSPDDLPVALAQRAGYLLSNFAPLERFMPAAEEAIRADAASPWVALMLGWSYLVQYRFDEAEELTLRILRIDPTEELFQTLLETTRTVRGVVDDAAEEGITIDDIRRSGVLETTWRLLRERELGIDLDSALVALEEVLPAEVRATLSPPASPEQTEEAGALAGESLALWHDGQRPGVGDTWGLGGPFRLMTAAEMIALEDAIDADASAYPGWPENDVREAVMTDDAGDYLVVVSFGAVVKRRAGQPDEPLAPSMGDWVWAQVARFGGADQRPASLRIAAADFLESQG
ncbi:hypothetical protein ASG90_18850 [Nocardioides sp. Soil797]|nr:hypothetical protein ASG90_18850 [Nocardioides sp. Soil797]